MFKNLYEYIGEKIKILAKLLFVLGAVSAIITGFALLIDWGFSNGWWALFIIILGPIIAWVSTWLLYAFGEIVENIQALKNQTSMICNIDKNLQIIAQPTIDETKKKIKREIEERAKHKADTPPTKNENTFSEKSWICGKCATKNLHTREDCWCCGNPK